MSLSALFLHLNILVLTATATWGEALHTGNLDDGGAELVANQYLKKIFMKYGVDVGSDGEMGETMLAEIMESLGLGVIHKIPTAGMGEDQDHDDHHHRKKRNSERPQNVNKFVDLASSIPHLHEDVSGRENDTDCRTAPLLLREYKLDGNVTRDSGIGPYLFRKLCPALVYLTVEKACIELDHVEEERPNTAEIWGYGILSVTIISLLSIVGAAIIPFISASYFETVLSVMVAGAVGALCGDALLHLIPHTRATSHNHSKEEVYKNLVVLLGIYLLFLIEGIMKLSRQRKRSKKKESKRGAKEKTDRSVHSSVHNLDREDDIVHVSAWDMKRNHSEEDESDHEHKGHNHAHDHGDMKDKGIASMAWMVIAGDGMHNFSDGIAIGAAFSTGIFGGLSTSIAVFCHEVPHELGDFAMLLKSGMSIKQALLYNGFAACFGYLGLFLGILVANYAENVTPWIFAITAGMFLYVALVDMLPEMNSCMTKMKTKSAFSAFLLQNVGLLIGIGIMLFISLFEENLKISG